MSVLLLRSWQRVNAFVFHSNSPFSFISMHLLNCPSLISRPNCCSSPSALPWHLSRPPFSNICLGMFGESWRLLQNKYKRDLAPYLPTRFPKSTNKLKSSPAKALLTKTPAASSRRSRIWKNSNEKQNQTRQKQNQTRDQKSCIINHNAMHRASIEPVVKNDRNFHLRAGTRQMMATLCCKTAKLQICHSFPRSSFLFPFFPLWQLCTLERMSEPRYEATSLNIFFVQFHAQYWQVRRLPLIDGLTRKLLALPLFETKMSANY